MAARNGSAVLQGMNINCTGGCLIKDSANGSRHRFGPFGEIGNDGEGEGFFPVGMFIDQAGFFTDLSYKRPGPPGVPVQVEIRQLIDPFDKVISDRGVPTVTVEGQDFPKPCSVQ